MKKVVVLKIEDYQLDLLKERISRAIKEHFSFKEFSAQDKVLLKPNLLSISSPQDAIVTHPVFIEAIGRIYQDLGCQVFIADSPAGFVKEKDVDYVYEKLGLKALAKRCDFKLLYPTQAKIRQGIPLCWWTDSFKMVNLPKLKTHDIMVLTLAVKNLYGCISGMHKSRLHCLHPKTFDFAKVILSLYKNIKPYLNIVDGILGMEGQGPAKKGRPKKINIVVIGDDALAVDYAIGKFLKLPDQAHPLIRAAKEEGILEEDIDIISEVEEGCGDFAFPAPSIVNRLPQGITPLVKHLLKFRPVIEKSKCTGCALCQKVCPSKCISLDLEEDKAKIDYKNCITCMCCAEVCQFAAVDLDKSLLLKIISKFN
jgi:uncharacterized protein (DUF362 family)/Pyruvate/2-oxoacid:ferredoxin oxidoreductase delta subunit